MLNFELYDMPAGVKAFSTTRRGGVSQGNYGEFNINEFCGDNWEHVTENRQRLAEELGVAVDHIILPHQVHGVEVCSIGSDYFSLPENRRKMALEGIDAVMTDQKGVCVGVSTADCIPVLLYDEEHHAVAAIHAGWRGTVARIVSKTVRQMQLAYDTDPQKLRAVIGPGISLDSFEVGDEVYAAFEQANFPMGEIAELRKNLAYTGQSTTQPPMKWHLNLPLCNKLVLMSSGVAAENIQDCGICTYVHSDVYFSARKLGTQSGRIYNAIMMER